MSAPNIVEIQIPDAMSNLIIRFLFLLPFIIISVVFGILIKILISASSSARAKKASAFTILCLLSVIIVFLFLYFPKTLYNTQEQLHVTCGFPFPFITGSSYSSPPFPWQNSCIGWIGSLWGSSRTFLWLPFLLNVSALFLLLTVIIHFIQLIRQKFPKKVWISVLGIVLILSSMFTWQYFHPRGAINKEKAVWLYLEYLTKKDAQAIQLLTPQRYNNKKEIAELLDEFGGNTFENASIDFKATESSTYWYAAIKGVRIDTGGKRVPFNHTVSIQQLGEYNSDGTDDDRWYIMLGKYVAESGLPTIGPKLKIDNFNEVNTR